jgi:hypothetical protein
VHCGQDGKLHARGRCTPCDLALGTLFETSKLMLVAVVLALVANTTGHRRDQANQAARVCGRVNGSQNGERDGERLARRGERSIPDLRDP